jgi:putative transcriptional regulator
VGDGELTGRLLVASPWLGDDNFVRTVVLILDHGDDGALGLVLNRPSQTLVGDAIPGWGDQAAAPPYVHVGGPVGTTSAMALGRSGELDPCDGWRPLFDRLGTLDLTMRPSDIDVVIEEVRIFAGHSGWSAGQLEAEIAADMWFVVPSEPGDALCPNPATMWRDVLRRQPEPLASVANFPADLSLN